MTSTRITTHSTNIIENKYKYNKIKKLKLFLITPKTYLNIFKLQYIKTEKDQCHYNFCRYLKNSRIISYW